MTKHHAKRVRGSQHGDRRFSGLAAGLAVCAALAALGGAMAWADDPIPKPAPVAAKTSSDAAKLKKLSLEDLMEIQVSTVSRVDERLDESPGSVYVYSRDTIQNRGYRSLGELLQVVPGFSVFHRDLDFVVGVRGLTANDNEKVSLLINGQNVNGPNEFSFLNGPINLDSVERVEVVVGPSSLFQQGDTLAATINVITKDVEGIELISSVGNDLRYSETLMAGHRWAPDRSLSISVTTEAKKGFDAWSRGFRNAPADDRQNFPLGQPGRNLTGQLDEPDYFGIAHGQYGELTGQFIAYKTSWPELHIDAGSPRNHGEMTEQFYTLFVKAEHVESPTLTVIARGEGSYREQSRLNNNGSPEHAEQQSIKQWDYKGELGLRYTGFESHVIQAGVQGKVDQDFGYFTFTNALAAPKNPLDNLQNNIPKTTLFDRPIYAVGFYVDDEYRLNDKWKVIAGARIDHNTELQGERWFPGARAALIYEPNKTWISKLIYNRSVRYPSPIAALNEKWGSQPDRRSSPTDPPFAQQSVQANQPEILSTIELDNTIYLGSTRLQANVYHEELEDFISFFEPHANGGNFRGNGAEVTFQTPITNDITLWANGAWNDTKLNLFNDALFGPSPQKTVGGTESIHSFVNKDHRIIGSPAYTANLGLAYVVTPNLTFSPSIRYFTEQAAVVDSSTAIKIRNQFYVDATLLWRNVAGKNMDLAFSGYNLLDNRHQVGSPFNGDTYKPRGISFVVSLTLRY